MAKAALFFISRQGLLEYRKSNPRLLCSLAGGQQSADGAVRVVGPHDLAHDGDPGGAGVEARSDEIGRHPAEPDDGDPEICREPDRRNAQRRTIAGLAGGEENRAQSHVVGAHRGCGGDIVEAMRGYSDQRTRAEALARSADGCGRLKMHRGPVFRRQIDIAAHREMHPVTPGDLRQAGGETPALPRLEVLVAQQQPAPAALSDPFGDHLDGISGLRAVGDDEKRRRQLFHEPTSPSCGLEGSARPRRGMRPARYAWRPASTAWRMAAAMRTGSSALATAVLRRTAAAPSSMAMTASDAVPMPASTMTGTAARRQISSRLAGLATPMPEPISEPIGITATAPTSASRWHTTGSSVQ